MSVAVYEGLAGGEAMSPQLELIVGGAGQIATAEATDEPQDSYKWEADYDPDGKISETRSWRYDAEQGESTFTRFGADGKVVDRFVKNEPLGITLQYAGDSLVYAAQVSNGGKNIERTWYGANRQPTSSVLIDVAANTQTMVIHQPGIGDWSNTTQYRGTEGWIQ